MKPKTKGFLFIGVFPLAMMMTVYFALVVDYAERTKLKPPAELTEVLASTRYSVLSNEYIDTESNDILVTEYLIVEYAGREIRISKLVGRTGLVKDKATGMWRNGETVWSIESAAGGRL